MRNEEGKGPPGRSITALSRGRAEERRGSGPGRRGSEDVGVLNLTLTAGRSVEGSVCSELRPPLQPPHLSLPRPYLYTISDGELTTTQAAAFVPCEWF